MHSVHVVQMLLDEFFLPVLALLLCSPISSCWFAFLFFTSVDLGTALCFVDRLCRYLVGASWFG